MGGAGTELAENGARAEAAERRVRVRGGGAPAVAAAAHSSW